MKSPFLNKLALLWLVASADAFVTSIGKLSTPSHVDASQLHVSIGLGPEKVEGEDEGQQLAPGVDYEVPDHESYRTSRRSKLDEQCDRWFGALLGTEDDKGILGPLADAAREVLVTPVPLVNEVWVVNSSSIWQFCN